MTSLLRAPFPWFGNKSKAVESVWQRFGNDNKNYVEPFFGAGAILLNAPSIPNMSVVNDIDGYICNFWRAVQTDFESVAVYANSRVNEIDLQARHQWLVNNRGLLTEKLKADPYYYCAKSAGWWAWGCSSWIGSGWCKDPSGSGVNRQLPHLKDKGQGVNRQLPHLKDKGQDLDRQLARHEFLSDWMTLLNAKMRDTRVACGDWKRICTPSTMKAGGRCAVFLDPPYGTNTDVYAKDSKTVWQQVQDWCAENGSDPYLRIALCGHVGQHERLESLGWDVVAYKTYGYQGADDRERIWFSPSCIQVKDLNNEPIQSELIV